MHNISLDGVCVDGSAPMAVNAICEVEIIFTGPSSTLQLSGKGRVIRRDDNGMAVKFTELEMDSYQHLRNIVLSNLAPTDD